ncbi:MAG: glycosyltransferase [Elusimicrobiota bacterium]|jgi:glycosyltransferase involved in cell wall biosynthesis
MTPKRLLFVSTSTTIGGAEKTLHTVATRLDRSRFLPVGVVSLKDKGPYAHALEEAGIPVQTLGVAQAGGFGPRSLRRLCSIIAELKPDIVHAQMYQAMQLCRAAHRYGRTSFKLVTSPRVHYRSRGLFSLAVDRFLKSEDSLLIAESDASRKHLIEHCGYAPEKVKRIYNGTALAGIEPSAQGRERVRKELRLPEDTVFIGAAGRLDEQKGHIFLLEALAQVRALFPVCCAILGEGPLRPALQKKLAELRIEDAVFLPGEQSNLIDWLSAFDVFVQPSLWEGLPNALLEAMALGLPAVAARVDGIPELVEDLKTGLLCESGDALSLFSPLASLCANAGLRRALGSAAKERIAADFKLSDMLSNYESAYAQVL